MVLSTITTHPTIAATEPTEKKHSVEDCVNLSRSPRKSHVPTTVKQLTMKSGKKILNINKSMNSFDMSFVEKIVVPKFSMGPNAGQDNVHKMGSVRGY